MLKEIETVTIRMNAVSAGPDGVRHKNRCYDVEVAEAKAIVDLGYAEYETVMVAVPKGKERVLKNVKELKAKEAAEKEADEKVKTPEGWKK